MSEFDDTFQLERHILASIPMARAMELRVVDYDGYRLALSAPLGPNINDKGCAFGGSMGSLLTLAGWGLVNLKLAEAGLAAEVYVQDTSALFLAPLWDEIVAEAYAPDNAWPQFIEHLRDKGRARITIEAEIAGADGGLVAARQSARYVAKSIVVGKPAPL
jgi:thioesterase domain-containing protein